MSGGVFTGTGFQFGVAVVDGNFTFAGAIDESSDKALGAWVIASDDETVVVQGAFQIVRNGSSETFTCTEAPQQLQPDMRLEGALGMNTGGVFVNYSGTIKNYGEASAKNPKVSVTSFGTAGNPISTDTDQFTVSILRPGQTTTFQIFTTVESVDLDSTAVSVAWDPAKNGAR